MAQAKNKIFQSETPILPALKANKPARKSGSGSPAGSPFIRGDTLPRDSGSSMDREEIILRLIEFFNKS